MEAHEPSLLAKAVGVREPSLTHYMLLARNFSRNRAVWRRKFYMDPAYREALTRAAGKEKVTSPFILQTGHFWCLPKVFPDKKCISYHDGNLAVRAASGFGLEGVSAKRGEQILRYEEDAARQMTAVFTFSEYLRQSFIRDYHVPAERVFNVGGGINLAEMPEPAADKDYATNRILFIGIEFERKGGPQLLEAFRAVREAIPTAELHIVGPAHVDNLPAGAIFHGRLSKSDPVQHQKLVSLFRDCSLFTLPSLYEPFGIAPLEAMLYGLPCVATNGWALPDFVIPGLTGELVEKGSVEDLAAKLTALLSDPNGLRRMGKQGRDLVVSRYTWASVVNRMADVIATL